MNRRFFSFLATGMLALLTLAAPLASQAADEAPDALVKRLSADVLGVIKADKSLQGGDINKIMALVDTRIMPNVNFRRMTAAAVGPAWRQATPEQKQRLQDEFKTLLVRTYAGALAQVSDQTIAMKPLRAAPEDKELVVRTEIIGQDDPTQPDDGLIAALQARNQRNALAKN